MTTTYQNEFVGNLLPTTILDRFFRDTEDIFSDYASAVPYNIIQGEGETRIEVALAGYSRKNIDVKIVDNELQISAASNKSNLKDGERYIHKGISERSVQLKFRITSLADISKIKSSFNDGMLEIKIPFNKKKTLDITVIID